MRNFLDNHEKNYIHNDIQRRTDWKSNSINYLMNNRNLFVHFLNDQTQTINDQVSFHCVRQIAEKKVKTKNRT